jgi:3-oxoacyl-[acyl-carrier protein] reductase
LPTTFEKADAVHPVATLVHTVTEEDVEAFAKLSGDRNPLHMDQAFANRAGFRGRVVHGIVTAGLVSRVIGMELPGAGSLWAKQEFEWLEPVFIGDRLEVAVTMVSKSEGTRTIAVKAEVKNQSGRIVMQGNGVVRLPDLAEQTSAVPLSERSVLITAGGTPLGVALARTFAEAGSSVTIMEAPHTAEELGGKVMALEGDFAQAVEKSRERFGKPVDVLIHNGSAEFSPVAFPALSWSAMERQMDSQLKGAFLASQAVIPGMLEAGSGCIVNVGSAAAWGVPPAQWTPHVVAMAALKAFTKSLAAEMGPKRIRVNMISAGMTDFGNSADIPERMRKLQAMQTPLRRLATFQELCSAVRFLCSEQAEFITGADVPVCGGLAM